MEYYDLNVEPRKKVGKSSTKALRNKDRVPCVMYGGEKNLHFSAVEKDFRNLVFTPNIYKVRLHLDGKTREAFVKQLQFHPVSDRLIHVDFIEAVPGKPIILRVPIRIVGSSIGIKNGGKMRQRRRLLRVSALPKDMPHYLEIDVTNLDINDTISIEDLQYPDIEILDPPRAMVVGIVSSRVVAKGMIAPEPVVEEVEEEVEAVEGEAVEGEAPEGEAPEGEEGAKKEGEEQKSE